MVAMCTTCLSQRRHLPQVGVLCTRVWRLSLHGLAISCFRSSTGPRPETTEEGLSPPMPWQWQAQSLRAHCLSQSRQLQPRASEELGLLLEAVGRRAVSWLRMPCWLHPVLR